jgi:hypothetical protein
MSIINTKRLGLAIGSTFALLYVACIIVVMTVGKNGVVFILNTLFHGIDVTSLIRTTILISSMFIGLVEIFIMGWLIGATIASIYNIGAENNK